MQENGRCNHLESRSIVLLSLVTVRWLTLQKVVEADVSNKDVRSAVCR